MIYTLPEAISFRDHFNISHEFKSRKHLSGFIKASVEVAELTNPIEIIERTIRSNFIGVNVDEPADRCIQFNKSYKILFDLSLEDLVPLINEPEPYLSFVEWRLKIGK